MPAYARRQLNERQAIRLLRNTDLSQLSGATLYLGYGDSLDDMLTRQTFKAVYTVPKN